jgi:hypothetical protein
VSAMRRSTIGRSPRDRAAVLVVEFDASVGAYLGRTFSGEGLLFIVGAMLLPPLVVLIVGAIVAWIARGFRGA